VGVVAVSCGSVLASLSRDESGASQESKPGFLEAGRGYSSAAVGVDRHGFAWFGPSSVAVKVFSQACEGVFSDECVERLLVALVLSSGRVSLTISALALSDLTIVSAWLFET
jgi:hypothetical protein